MSVSPLSLMVCRGEAAWVSSRSSCPDGRGEVATFPFARALCPADRAATCNHLGIRDAHRPPLAFPYCHGTFVIAQRTNNGGGVGGRPEVGELPREGYPWAALMVLTAPGGGAWEAPPGG